MERTVNTPFGDLKLTLTMHDKEANAVRCWIDTPQDAPITVNGIPESPYEVVTLGTDATDSSHFGTDGSELAAGVSSTAVTLSVATTGPSGILWTTSGADFPFNIIANQQFIDAGGQKMDDIPGWALLQDNIIGGGASFPDIVDPLDCLT